MPSPSSQCFLHANLDSRCMNQLPSAPFCRSGKHKEVKCLLKFTQHGNGRAEIRIQAIHLPAWQIVSTGESDSVDSTCPSWWLHSLLSQYASTVSVRAAMIPAQVQSKLELKLHSSSFHCMHGERKWQSWQLGFSNPYFTLKQLFFLICPKDSWHQDMLRMLWERQIFLFLCIGGVCVQTCTCTCKWVRVCLEWGRAEY